MTKIKIADELLEKCPYLKLACLECDVVLEKETKELWKEIDYNITEMLKILTIERISKTPNIAASRIAYKSIGKDPSRYRLSAEALSRRIIQGKGLYQINNVVDLVNLTSIASGFSIGGYDVNAIEGEVTFGIGKPNEAYEGIGRGKLNIDCLPVFRDQLGAFGSPTSDSPRTSVTMNTQRFLMVIIDFDNRKSYLDNTTPLAERLLTSYASATNLKQWKV